MIEALLARLQQHYGNPPRPPARGPFEWILWEHCGYLLPDDKRSAVFEALGAAVGLTPHAIASADDDVLLPLARLGGMRPEERVERWREIARIALEEFDGDLDRILHEPTPKAIKALKLFPSIGDPGAAKILLFCGVGTGLPLESNGLRVLVRVGYGRAQKNYTAEYRSVQEAIAGGLPGDTEVLTAAHLLLREHGKALCKTSAPWCAQCPVVDLCAFGKSRH